MISPSHGPLSDNTQISMPRVGFEPTISAGGRPLGSTGQALRRRVFG